MVGAPVLAIAENAMTLLNIPALYRYRVRGLMLRLAVLLDTLRTRSLRRT